MKFGNLSKRKIRGILHTKVVYFLILRLQYIEISTLENAHSEIENDMCVHPVLFHSYEFMLSLCYLLVSICDSILPPGTNSCTSFPFQNLCSFLGEQDLVFFY